MIRMRVRGAGFERDEDVEASILVMAEKANGSGRRLEIQRALRFSSDDKKLGWDTYCVVNETGATRYGGIRKVVFERDELRLLFDTQARRTFRTPGYLLKLDDDEVVAEVETGLPVVLGKKVRHAPGPALVPLEKLLATSRALGVRTGVVMPVDEVRLATRLAAHPQSAVLPALVLLARDPNPHARKVAIWALDRMMAWEDQRGLAQLIASLSDSTSWVRDAAARILRESGTRDRRALLALGRRPR